MQSKDKKLARVLTTLMVASTCFSAAYANEENYLNSDPINITGYVSEAPPVTDAELENVNSELKKQKNAIIINKEKKKKYNQLSKSTEKLADVTEEMIEERKESQETIDKFNKKIDCLMAEGMKEGCEEYVKAPKQDTVKTTQAAVVETKVEPSKKVKGEIKVLPYSGLTTFISDNENLEASAVAGLNVETDVSERFSVGVGFTYTSLTTNDYGNGYIDNSYLGYYNSFYGGREIEYKNMKFNLYSKYYMVKNDRFRPYIGAGVGYNRTKMNYTNNQSANPYYGSCNGIACGYSFGNEEVVKSNISVDAMLGSEVRFTESIGANIELNYMSSFGGNLSSENGINAYKAPDQKRLEDFSKELGNANIVSLYAGLLVTF